MENFDCKRFQNEKKSTKTGAGSIDTAQICDSLRRLCNQDFQDPVQCYMIRMKPLFDNRPIEKNNRSILCTGVLQT